MSGERKITQINLETRKINAVFTDDGAELEIELPVFAWALFDDGDVEPLFISKEYSGGGRNPQTAGDIKYLSGGKLDVLHFVWES